MASVSPAGTNANASSASTAATTTVTAPSAVPSSASSPPSAAVPSAAALPTSSVAANPASPASASKASALPTITLQRADPPKNLRGLNKPKCIKCGNVARSRCPYQSCKSCCSKAQNPCHIHVLKPNATLADRSPSSNSNSDQQPNEASSSGPSRPASIRQLSSTFAQFNNVHIPLRSKKPLTRKDAITINEWRFSKLKEFRDRNIGAENEAFDRYMQNVSLLEEIFDVNTMTTMEDSFHALNPPVDKTNLLSAMKVKLRSDPIRVDKFRKRIRNVVEQGLRKLQKSNQKDSANDLNGGTEHNLTPREAKILDDAKASLLSQLNDKINKARNEDDLNLCLQMMSQLGSHQRIVSETGISGNEIAELQTTEPGLPIGQATDSSLLKMVKTNVIGQEALNKIDSHFLSLEEIEDL